MKRIIVFLLVLAAGTALSAQEFKWSGYFNSGLGVVATDVEGIDLFAKAFGNDAEQNGFRFRLNGDFTNADANAGVSFRFQAQATTFAQNAAATATTALGYFSLPYAYGWLKFLNGIITVKGGIVDDGTWNSAGYLLGRPGGDQSEGLGALLRISPVTGLDLGAGAYVNSLLGGGANNFLALPFGDGKELDDVKYTFNLGYTVPDLLKVVASFRPESATGNAASSRAIIGVSILAVPGLTAILEGELDKLQDFSNIGTISVYETLGYKIGDLGFGLNAAEYLTQVDGADISIEAAPWVSYTLGNIVPRLDVTYFLGGTTTVASANTYGRLTSYATSPDADNRVLSVRPSVKINVGSAFVELGDVVYLVNTAAADSFWNVFYVDFKWSF
ncbi:MAG: hypothetical protein LBQ35_08625 [Spirochaetaceae bacterium]|jgi:hypothetical protein|nr:hypothetical protein [Spirochaetaceae bacterium]